MDFPNFEYKGEAACRAPEVNPDDFFMEPDQPNFVNITRAAKAVCKTCPYMAECLAYALENNQPGVWGGTSGNDRRRIKREKKLALGATIPVRQSA